MPIPCSLAQERRDRSLSHLWLRKGSKMGNPWSLLIRRSTLSKKDLWSLLSPKLGLTSIYLKTQDLVTSHAKVKVVPRRIVQPYLIAFLVNDIPSKPDFSFTYRPTPTTLFRFSALTFNGHHIHLDKDCTRIRDGYPGLCSDTAHVYTSSPLPERLVHGPLTALMLLETVAFHNPGLMLKSLEYRAINPMFVNREMTINGTWLNDSTARLWCMDEKGVVGMIGSIEKAN